MSNIDYTALGLPDGVTSTTANSPATVPTVTDGYLGVPITVNPEQLIADAFAFIAAQIPGWVPHEGQLEVWLIEVIARMVTVSAQVASQVPVSVFSWFGAALLGVAPNPGAPAQSPTTWTMVDASGYTVPAGTVVSFGTGAQAVYFTVTETFVVPSGQTQTPIGSVSVTASAYGSAGNGYGPGPVNLVNSLACVQAVTAVEPSSGGADPETTLAYLNRLSDELKLLTPRPILAADFAALAATQPGVTRAVGLDNFDANANLLTAVDASFETGLGTWTAGPDTTIATSTVWAGDGSQSMALTAAAAGEMQAQSGWYPVSPGLTYTAMAAFHAATNNNLCNVNLVWADINFNVLSTSTGGQTYDSTVGGVDLMLNAQAPSQAAYAAVQVQAAAAAAGRTHLVDQVGLFLGNPSAWSPGGVMSGQTRWVTVVPVDSNGNALAPAEMTALAAWLASQREVNFNVAVVPPTYEAVAVAVTVVAQPNADIDTVQASVTTALADYLSPANWAGGSQTPPVWRNDNTIHYLSVGTIIGNVAGVQYVQSLTLNGSPADLTLVGFASLPQPQIAVQVVAAPAGT